MAVPTGSLFFDALIIGAGPAGLSVATGLARQLHTAVIFDSGVYRNARTNYMHNVVGWDHRDPAEFRSAGRADLLKRYATIQFQDVAINSVRQLESQNSGFEAIDQTGKAWYGRKLVLATGVRDIPVEMEGYSDCWGRGIFHCLFCDGYEERGQSSVGVLATGPVMTTSRILHQCRMALRLSASVTVYTNGDEALTREIQTGTYDARICIDARPITRLQKLPDASRVLVHFEKDQDRKEEGFLIHNPVMEVNGPFVDQLVLKTTPEGDIEVSSPFNETSMHGVFAAGDCAITVKAVTPAMSSGTVVAAGVVTQLQAESTVS